MQQNPTGPNQWKKVCLQAWGSAEILLLCAVAKGVSTQHPVCFRASRTSIALELCGFGAAVFAVVCRDQGRGQSGGAQPLIPASTKGAV